MDVIKSSGIKVSVCVITYNQEQYIDQCIAGIMQQQANFAFEVIVRDDCSTDKTYAILCDIQKNYPSIIKLLDSSINLGSNKNLMRVFDAAEGEYLAICEGDDYWIDPEKLEKQVAALVTHPTINLCCHPSMIESKGKIRRKKFMGGHSNKFKILSAYDVVQGNGDFMSTPSLMLRRPAISSLPAWFGQTPTIDYYLQIYGSLHNGCVYLPDPMSVYRKNSVNSWSERMQTTSSKITFYLQFIDFFDQLHLDLGAKYQYAIQGAQSRAYSGMALTYVNASYKDEFMRYIKLSWSTRSFMSIPQIIAYSLRHQPWCVKLIYKYARKFLG